MNFCSSCLQAKISCSAPAADNHSVNNLISSVASERQLGFVSESFVRPPVDVEVFFSVPIDINQVVISTKVSLKQSCSFSVFVYLQTPDDNDNDNSTQTTTQHNEDIYLCVGKFFTHKEDIVHLKNPHYRHWMNIPPPPNPTLLPGQTVFTGSLRHPNHQALKNVRRLKLRVLRNASSGGSPVGALEVWGQPGLSTPLRERKLALQRWLSCKEALQPVVNKGMYGSFQEETKENTGRSNQCEDNNELVSVPEDFLDAITCELMVIPLLLPSGHSVDASTLDRLVAGDGAWGRAATDPFTGVPFTPTLRPLPNLPLKARIDRYVLLNQVDSGEQNQGRTLLPVQVSYGPTSSSSSARSIVQNEGENVESGSASSKEALMGVIENDSSKVASNKREDPTNSSQYPNTNRNKRKKVEYNDQPNVRALRDDATKYSASNLGVATSSGNSDFISRFIPLNQDSINCNTSRLRKDNNKSKTTNTHALPAIVCRPKSSARALVQPKYVSSRCTFNRASDSTAQQSTSNQNLSIYNKDHKTTNSTTNTLNDPLKCDSDSTTATIIATMTNTAPSNATVTTTIMTSTCNATTTITSTSISTVTTVNTGIFDTNITTTCTNRPTTVTSNTTTTCTNRPNTVTSNTTTIITNRPTTVTSNTNVPLSRSLLHHKPATLVRGDGLPPQHNNEAYMSHKVLRSADRCSRCSAEGTALYVLELCGHLLCRACLQHSEEDLAGGCEGVEDGSSEKVKGIDGALVVAVGKERSSFSEAVRDASVDIGSHGGSTQSSKASIADVRCVRIVSKGVSEPSGGKVRCGICDISMNKNKVRKHHNKSVYNR